MSADEQGGLGTVDLQLDPLANRKYLNSPFNPGFAKQYFGDPPCHEGGIGEFDPYPTGTLPE
nr:hypothetical protein [Desulfuromonas versatilis]